MRMGQMIPGLVELRWLVRPSCGLEEGRTYAAIHEIHDALRIPPGCRAHSVDDAVDVVKRLVEPEPLGDGPIPFLFKMHPDAATLTKLHV